MVTLNMLGQLPKFWKIPLVLVISIIYVLHPNNGESMDSSGYKFLFRNDIASYHDDPKPIKKGVLEIAPVIRGDIYRPEYYYHPGSRRFIVYSTIFEPPHRFELDQNKAADKKKWVDKFYALIDVDGKILSTVNEGYWLSRNSGVLFGKSSYIDWPASPSAGPVAYARVVNSNLDMSEDEWIEEFSRLYRKTSAVEFVGMADFNTYMNAALFRTGSDWTIMFSGRNDDAIREVYGEGPSSWRDSVRFRLNSGLKGAGEYSERAGEALIRLVSPVKEPYRFRNSFFSHTLKVVKFEEEYNSGWVSLFKIWRFVVSRPPERTGIAYVRLSVGKEFFLLKVPKAKTNDFYPGYNIGLRTLKLPDELSGHSKIVFLESTQNSQSGSDGREGRGVYVIRSRQGHNFTLPSDLPDGISEERFGFLPVKLQEALVNRKTAAGLELAGKSITSWFPEIELLSELRYLEITNTGLSEIPDGIANLKKLKKLDLSSNSIKYVSTSIAELPVLEELDLSINDLSEFPIGVTGVKTLKRLYIGANKITKVPSEIVGLKNLELLDLMMLDIEQQPPAMAEMTKLKIDSAEKLQKTSPLEQKGFFR